MPSRISGTIYSLSDHRIEPLEEVTLTGNANGETITDRANSSRSFCLGPGPTNISINQLEGGLTWSINKHPNSLEIFVNILRGRKDPGRRMKVFGRDAAMEASVETYAKITAERF
ncbi:hypothetical protein HY029_04910 [Candidatus Gottesmanbacteria bacterium]|nr:hypothetical protein [Candidatus Gottesmanbacteria bacterium]